MITQNLITKRCGVIDPRNIDSSIQAGAYSVLAKVLKQTPLSVIEEIKKSKIRGRGGAGFPAHVKMMGLYQEKSPQKYVVCNADEGEPGNFKDRYLMENDPHQILEGMLIAAYATGATKGYIYIRGEYQESIQIMKNAIVQAYEKGFLGQQLMENPFTFDLEVRSGAGSYVCGEEFSLLESIEGKAGRTRVKPPFPTSKGLFMKPTLINNVETFANYPVIMDLTGAKYAEIGTPTSTGTKLISLSGNIQNKGVFEVPFGVPFRQIIDELGGGIPNGRSLKMVQLGGVCGPIIPEYLIDMIVDYERFEVFESKTGAGAIIVIDDHQDLFSILENISDFFAHESCGKCTPCREGHAQIKKTLNRFIHFKACEKDLTSLESQARIMHQTSLCGLGQSAPTSIISALYFFRNTFFDRINASNCQEVSS
jgi:NADH-quinone oxidoreductase subunit F